METLDPLETTRRIGNSYRRYLRSTFAPRRSDLEREFNAALANSEVRLTRGPFLQASAPFEPGCSVADLVADGVLHDDFLRLKPKAFPVHRKLHRHQEDALRKAVSRRNLIVSTGTGSGKTETFTLPILHGLLGEGTAGTLSQPGVRALLLYPMNALANDQVKRLRVLLQDFPEITFGRYIGDTKDTESKAISDFVQRYPNEPRLANELLSRDQMKAAPPHILLTNYAMLEYLLLRPADSAFFDGPFGEHWRTIVLDEAHTYNGAQGTEVAMLLRRVRERVVKSETGRLQCFATSATLGRGRQDFPDLIKFANDLFTEPFEWADDDPLRQDIVTATRLPMVRADHTATLPRALYQTLRKSFRSDADVATLAALVREQGVPAPEHDETTEPSKFLHDLLCGDGNVIALQERLQQHSVELSEAAEIFDGPGSAEDVVALVDLCVAARAHANDAPLIPARYHYFLRALEGGYACFHPEHRDGEARFLLARHEQCPSCRRLGKQAKMFEFGICRHCRSEYLMGDLPAGGGLFQMAPAFRDGRAYLLLGEAVEDDEDEAAAGFDDILRDHRYLCPACGTVGESSSCTCGGSPALISVTVARAGADGVLHNCIACAGRSNGDVVLSLTTGTDAPVSVLATELYQAIPASSDETQNERVGEGRKLLVFADSRQDAAYFAPYLERTYRRAVQRRLIAFTIEQLSGTNVPRANDIIENLRGPMVEHRLTDELGDVALKREAGYWVAMEMLALDRRQSIEGTGTAEISIAFPHKYVPPRPLLDLGFEAQEVTDLLQLLFETVRSTGAVSTPDQVLIKDPRFAPRAVDLGLREQGSGYGVITWMPGAGRNRRLEILQKIFARKAIDADPLEVLQQLWVYLTDRNGIWTDTLVATTNKQGPRWKVNWRSCEFRLLAEDHRPYRCAKCHRLTWRSVSDICPAWRCDGAVSQISDLDELRANHYASLYQELQPIGIAVQEHTAQWDSTRAGEIQQEFVEGKINVLSCSTTFELGVDVGEVQTVLLRNVPPSAANYVQRAGRAGRRTDSAALVVTFAQRRNHDLHYFANPIAMVDGEIAPPRILLDNALIVRRHAHSVAFAAHERLHVDSGGIPHRTVADYFATSDDDATTADAEFLGWLRSRPSGLGDALARVAPASTHAELDLAGWGWVEALAEESDDDPTHGWLQRAGGEVREDLETLQDFEDEAGAAKNYRLAQKYAWTRKTLASRQLLSFLASRNVLPKYGFPVDVVQLDLARAGNDVGVTLDLSRDLKLAIREYAPGSEVVAGKELWKCIGLGVRAGHGWPTHHWVVCQTCGVYSQNLGVIDACKDCGSQAFSGRGTMVIPVFGFVGADGGKPGESRPTRSTGTTSYFGSYKSEVADFAHIDGLGVHAHVTARTNRQGRIAVINEGSGGFRLCERCGYAAAGRSKVSKGHEDIRFAGRQCGGMIVHRQLGHEFLTDVVEIKLGSNLSWEEGNSVLYALLEGATSLSILRDDIDGTLHAFGGAQPSLVLFDAVPGGAGHAQRIFDHLPEVIRAAHKVVSSCECGEETSCYLCIRSYSNQTVHDLLQRGAAKNVLEILLR